METTNGAQTLLDKVKGYRSKARDILRMSKINDLLQKKYRLDDIVKELKHALEEATKDKARVEYNITKLDTLNPDYEIEKKFLDNKLKEINECIEKLNNDITAETKKIEEKSKDIDNSIAKWENGDSLVNIDDVYQIAEEMLAAEAIK